MGYEAPLRLQDATGARWVGVHAPQRADVRPLLAALLDEPLALDDAAAVEARLQDAGQTPARLGPRVWRVGEVVLKISCPRDRDRRGLGGSLARRAHARAHQLRAHGLGAPTPLAFLERARGPRRHVSLGVSAHVPGPSLRAWWQDSLLPLARSAPERFVADKRARLAQVARALRAMHQRGIFHGDLHAENLLVGPHGLVVLDLESIRRGPGARRVVDKTLARLERDASDLGGLTRTDRLRFLDVYLAASASPRAQRRRLWRRVEVRAARRVSASVAAGTSAGAPGPV